MRHPVLSSLALGGVAAALAASATTVPATAAPDGGAAPPPPPPHHARRTVLARTPLGGRDTLTATQTTLDRDGSSHVRFQRSYRGLEVVGGDLVVHQGPDAGLESLTGRTPAVAVATTPTVSPQRAARTAGASVSFARSTARPELVVLAVDRAPALAWRVDVTGRRADGSPAGEYVFVAGRGAGAGRVLDRWPSVLEETGSGNGISNGQVSIDTTAVGSGFQMIDPVRGGNATYNGPATAAPVFADPDNVWGNGSPSGVQSAGVDAHYGIAETWDYFLTTFDRSGIADDGQGARSFVHDGQYVNASWSDSCFCMRYGDGDATTYLPLTTLDIAGHEMTHGVTSRTAGLIYRGESGGLNEATSDIFGTSVEFFARNADDPADYVIGEEIFRTYRPATNFIRRMDKPSLDGSSQNCYNNRTRNIDVHYSSGPANHFFYLLAEGSGAKTINGVAYNSPTCNGATITGIGRDAAQRIWYRALTVYMTSSTGYAGARTATVSAAVDLYGTGSAQVAAVRSAWTAVAVTA